MKIQKKERKLIIFLSLLCVLLLMALLFVLYRNNYFAVFRQVSTSSYDYTNNAQYIQRQTLFETLPLEKSDVIFVGDSITARCEWQEFYPEKKVLNRGIDSDVTEGVRNRLDVITASQPDKIFIMIGINDIRQKIPTTTTLTHYEELLTQLKEVLPDTELYIQSVLPIGDNTGMSNEDVQLLNTELLKLATKMNLTYIDLYSLLIDETGYLPDACSIDGVHLTGQGYAIWIKELNKYM